MLRAPAIWPPSYSYGHLQSMMTRSLSLGESSSSKTPSIVDPLSIDWLSVESLDSTSEELKVWGDLGMSDYCAVLHGETKQRFYAFWSMSLTKSPGSRPICRAFTFQCALCVGVADVLDQRKTEHDWEGESLSERILSSRSECLCMRSSVQDLECRCSV